MSLAKVFWLNHTLLTFFAVPAMLARDRTLAPRTRRALRMHLGSFVGRGLVELWMLYRTRSWRVAYGVGHDVAHLGVMEVLRPRSPAAGDADANALRHLGLVQVSLIAEVLFATLFHRAVGGKTRGSKAIYFASTAPQFRRINRLTSIINIIVYTWLGRVITGMSRHASASK